MKTILIILFIFLFSAICFAQNDQNNAVPFTLADRDRIIRLEEKMDAKFDAIDAKFDAMDAKFDAKFDALDQRMDQLFNFLWVLMGMFTVITAAAIGFAFWDRKTTNAPLIKENKRIISILKEYSKNEPQIAEILRNAGIL